DGQGRGDAEESEGVLRRSASDARDEWVGHGGYLTRLTRARDPAIMRLILILNTMLERTMRWLPLGLLGVFFAVALGFRGALHFMKHGGTGVVAHRRPGLGEIGAAVVPLGLFAEAVRAALWPQPHGAWLALPGVALWLSGLVVVVAAQLQMGASWRVGIDAQARPGLITHGLYARSRNPIYSGLLLALAGFALVLPT